MAKTSRASKKLQRSNICSNKIQPIQTCIDEAQVKERLFFIRTPHQGLLIQRMGRVDEDITLVRIPYRPSAILRRGCTLVSDTFGIGTTSDDLYLPYPDEMLPSITKIILMVEAFCRGNKFRKQCTILFIQRFALFIVRATKKLRSIFLSPRSAKP